MVGILFLVLVLSLHICTAAIFNENQLQAEISHARLRGQEFIHLLEHYADYINLLRRFVLVCFEENVFSILILLYMSHLNPKL